MEDHPPDGHLRLQHLEQVPGDRLALAILVRREQELVGVGSSCLSCATSSSCRGRRRRAARSRARRRRRGAPTAPPCTSRDLGGAVGQVADVADGGLDDEVRPEVAGDRPRLRRGLDDDQALRHRRVTIASALDTPRAPASAAPLQRRRRAELACPARAVPAARPRTRERACERWLRPLVQSPLQLRPVAARDAALAAALAAFHGEGRALLVAGEVRASTPRALSRCTAASATPRPSKTAIRLARKATSL